MRGLRLAGIVAGSVAAVLATASLLAWLLFDPNDYKDELQGAFRAATGRDLRLEGPLALSVFPWLAVETGAATVSNRQGFGTEPFAALTRARLGVRWWPLVTARRLEFGPVRIDGLALNLAVARDGSNNWSDLLERLEERAPAAVPPEGAKPAAELSIARLELRDAALRFADAQAGARYSIEQCDLATGRLRKGEAVEVETSLRLDRNERSIGRLQLRTRLDARPGDRLELHDLEGTVQLARTGGQELPVALRVPQVVVAHATRNLEVKDLEARLGDAVLTATLAIVQGDAGPQARGRIRVAETNPRTLLQALGLEVPATRDADALTRVAAQSLVAYSAAGGLQLDSLDLRLDDTTLAGRLTLADVERRAVRFELRGNAIDLDRYLPRQGSAPAEPGPAPAPGRAPPQADGARGLDVRGSLALGRLVFAGMALQDVDASVRVAGGRLALDPMRARVFGGTAVTKLDYELAARAPTLRIEQRLAGVDVAAMLGQLTPVRALEGRGDAHFTLTTRGAGADALFANLSGPFEVTVTDGALIGTDLWYEIERAVAAAQLEPSALAHKGSGRTPFQRLVARGTLADRALRNDRLEFAADFARVEGRGRVDYGRNRLDLDLTARLLKAPPGRFLGIKASRLQRADIPLRVTGTLADPQVRPNVSKLLESAAKDAIRKPLEDKLKEQIDKIFKF